MEPINYQIQLTAVDVFNDVIDFIDVITLMTLNGSKIELTQ